MKIRPVITIFFINLSYKYIHKKEKLKSRETYAIHYYITKLAIVFAYYTLYNSEVNRKSTSTEKLLFTNVVIYIYKYNYYEIYYLL